MSKRKSSQADNNDLNGSPVKKLLNSYSNRLSTAQNDLLSDMPYERNSLVVTKPNTDCNNNSIASTSKRERKQIYSGVIERVSLKNFKCHSMLEFDLGSNINFILGRNGSGKSAVMDGIILCLGGRTTVTGRTGSAKTFIKKNADNAQLSVTLRNSGNDAYLKEKYGGKIRIERRLTKEGGSTYKIFSEKNELISIKKNDIDDIMEHFNIQIDNQVCFLNQETSKQFLNSSDSSKKYQLFLKASQIAQMKEIIEKINNERNQSEQLLEKKTKQWEKLRNELYELIEKYEKSCSIELLRKKLSGLLHEHGWAVAYNIEQILKNYEEKLTKQLNIQEKNNIKLKNSKDSLEKVNQEYKTIKEKISELTDQSKIAKTEFETVNETYKKVAAEHKTVASETKKLTALIEKKTKERDDIKNKLEEERNLDNGEQNYEVERRQKEEKIQSIEEKLKEKLEMEKEKTQEYRNFCQELDSSQKSFDEKKHHLKNVDGLIKRLNEDIENLGKSTNDQIYRYGNFMPIILKDIEAHYQNRKFKEKPIGPIGMYIQPKDDRYSLAIESCLGGVLTNFICANYDDEKVLRQIIDKHVKVSRQKPSIVVIDFSDARYDVSRFNRDFPEHPTVYDMLNIRDNVVANVLIDQKRIETVLLLPDYETARDIIERKSTTNFNQAYTPNGDQYLGKPSFRFYASQSTESRYFIKSTEAAIQSKRNEIAKLTEDMEMVNQTVRKVNEELSKNKQLKQQSEHQTSLLKKEINNLKIKLDEAKNIHIPEPANLAVFEDEINRLEIEINGFREQIQNIENNSGASIVEFENATNEKQRREVELQSIQAEILKQSDKYESKKVIINDIHDEVRFFSKKYEEAKKKIIEIQEFIKENEKELKDQILKLKNDPITCDRIETKKKTVTLENEIKILFKQIDANEKTHGDVFNISKAIKKMDIKQKNIKNEIKKQLKFQVKLNDVVTRREEKIAQFIRSKANRCTQIFTQFLNNRNFNGNLKFNHETKTLDVIVHPNKSRDNHELRDLKSLSGGERSFSTVAFLISLWSVVESPILILDEFDVFMDQVNREIALQLIIDSAKKNLCGQYIFLTPQDMKFINPDKYIKIYEMPEPKRYN